MALPTAPTRHSFRRLPPPSGAQQQMPFRPPLTQLPSYSPLPMAANRREPSSSFSPHQGALQRNSQPMNIFIDFSQDKSMIAVSRPRLFMETGPRYAPR